MNMICPKCGSDDVLLGHEHKPNKCAECDHTWKNEGEASKDIALAKHEGILKSPEVLLTINSNFRRRRLLTRLDEALFSPDSK